MIWLFFKSLNAPNHHCYLLVPRISCRFQGQWLQTVGAHFRADQTGSFTVQFKVTSPLWVLTSNSLILSRAGCMFMHASANHCLPPSLRVPRFVVQPSPGTYARSDTEVCFPTMVTMVTHVRLKAVLSGRPVVNRKRKNYNCMLWMNSWLNQ